MLAIFSALSGSIVFGIKERALMETLDAIRTRRSVRAFREDALDPEVLKTILEAGACAPSGGNAQPWVFIGVQQKRRLQALRALSPGMVGVPAAAVVLCLDGTRTGKNPDSPLAHMVWMDLGAAMENMLLAAHDAGLGACAVGSFNAQGVARLLNLPEHLSPALILIMGAPLKIPACPARRSLSEVIHLEQFGGVKDEH
jgi:nitroreductase